MVFLCFVSLSEVWVELIIIVFYSHLVVETTLRRHIVSEEAGSCLYHSFNPYDLPSYHCFKRSLGSCTHLLTCSPAHCPRLAKRSTHNPQPSANTVCSSVAIISSTRPSHIILNPEDHKMVFDHESPRLETYLHATRNTHTHTRNIKKGKVREEGH